MTRNQVAPDSLTVRELKIPFGPKSKTSSNCFLRYLSKKNCLPISFHFVINQKIQRSANGTEYLGIYDPDTDPDNNDVNLVPQDIRERYYLISQPGETPYPGWERGNLNRDIGSPFERIYDPHAIIIKKHGEMKAKFKVLIQKIQSCIISEFIKCASFIWNDYFFSKVVWKSLACCRNLVSTQPFYHRAPSSRFFKWVFKIFYFIV